MRILHGRAPVFIPDCLGTVAVGLSFDGMPAVGSPILMDIFPDMFSCHGEQVAYLLAYGAITAASGDIKSTALDARGANEYFRGQQWAQPSVRHLRELMRRVGVQLAGLPRQA